MFPSRRLCTPSKANILMLPLRPAIEGRRPSTAAPLDDIMAGLEYNLRELAKQPYRRALLDEVTSDLVQLLSRLARRSDLVEQLIDGEGRCEQVVAGFVITTGPDQRLRT